MKNKIFYLLNKLGMPCNLKGRLYIETAIEIVSEKGEVSVTKELYPTIAKKHGTTLTRVERAIRHAIEMVFENGDMETLHEIFGNCVSKNSGKIVNSAFIYGIEKYIKVNCEVN